MSNSLALRSSEYHDTRRTWWEQNASLWSVYIAEAEGHRAVFLRIAEDLKTYQHATDTIPAYIDLGSGDGSFLRLIRDEHANASCTGIDFSSAMVSLAAKRSVGQSITYLEGDFETGAGIPDAQYDFVTAILSFAEAGDLVESFVTASRLLRPGGVCAVAFLDPVVDIARHVDEMPNAEAITPMLMDGGFVYTRRFRIHGETSPAPYSRVVRLDSEYDHAAARSGLIPIKKYRLSRQRQDGGLPAVYCVTYFSKRAYPQ